MNRAPAFASTAARLSFVGCARSRSASSETPSYRIASSSRFASAIWRRIPTGSATTGLDEGLETIICKSASNGIECHLDACAQRFGNACRRQQRACIESDDRTIRLAASPRKKCNEPLRIFLWRSGLDLLKWHSVEASLLGRNLNLLKALFNEGYPPRGALQDNFVEATTGNGPRPFH